MQIDDYSSTNALMKILRSRVKHEGSITFFQNKKGDIKLGR